MPFRSDYFLEQFWKILEDFGVEFALLQVVTVNGWNSVAWFLIVRARRLLRSLPMRG